MTTVLSLIGYRGTGKSTVGKRLARRLNWDWVDADHEIERRAGRTIKEIFAEDGEPEFRRLERETLIELLQRDKLVLSTGGGAILNSDTRHDLKAAGPIVWLVASVQTIASRILQDQSTKSRRPNLTAQGGIEEIREVMAKREPLYKECATVVLNTEGMRLAQVVDTIVDQLPADLMREVQP